ncbi:MAG: hypothetical protein H6561_21225 [Lewinellaceae bacterium]|nr:hypothetical protein [Lewinellaceae bacterium]
MKPGSVLSRMATAFSSYVKTLSGEPDYPYDPDRALSTMGGGVMGAFFLTDYRRLATDIPYISPCWQDAQQSFNIVKDRTSLSQLNNVDIVLTRINPFGAVVWSWRRLLHALMAWVIPHR